MYARITSREGLRRILLSSGDGSEIDLYDLTKGYRGVEIKARVYFGGEISIQCNDEIKTYQSAEEALLDKHVCDALDEGTLYADVTEGVQCVV